MSNHYYDRHPSAAHDRRVFEETIRGVTLKLVTDAGVFSKHGIDFGSKLLIRNLALDGHERMLDVGCGYGPIGLFAAKLNPAMHVTMLDINERAVELARENAGRNGIENVTVLQSDLYEQLREGACSRGMFSLIVTNPPIRAGKRVVHRIFEEGVEWLSEGGELWTVIRKQQGAPSALAKLQSLFSRVEEADKDKGYRIYRAIKSSSASRISPTAAE